MVTIMQLTDNLKSYISLQLESMAKTNPMIGFMKPLITRTEFQSQKPHDRSICPISEEAGISKEEK